MSVTAVTICREPVSMTVDGAEHVCHPGMVIKSAEQAQAAWFDSIDRVRTEWFFWLDSDDNVPKDIGGVLRDCQQTDLDIAYTDELVKDGERQWVHVPGPYSREIHLRKPSSLHHLVLCRTAAARRARDTMPRGHYWPEMMLFWDLARRGAHYVPRVGYVWRRSADGLSRKWWTTHGIVRSQLWAASNA